MISVEEALERMLAEDNVLRLHRVPLLPLWGWYWRKMWLRKRPCRLCQFGDGWLCLA